MIEKKANSKEENILLIHNRGIKAKNRQKDWQIREQKKKTKNNWLLKVVHQYRQQNFFRQDKENTKTSAKKEISAEVRDLD